MSTQIQQCCFCNGFIIGKSYDPSPLKESGECCSGCYHLKVVPARLRKMNEKDNDASAN